MANTADTSAIDKELYPLVETAIKKNLKRYKDMLSKFFEKRSKDLYSPIIGDRIAYGKEDEDALFKAIGISDREIMAIIQHTYYAKMPAFNPRAAKNPVVVLLMCLIKYFYKAKQQKDLELSMLYLAFSGNYYPSIHYGSFPTTTPAPHVMEYVINTQLSDKYNIAKEGSVLGAIKSICNTWINTYGKDMFASSTTDEEYVYMIQQLHVRIKSFMKNIAMAYYKAYSDKDASYMTYDSDIDDGEGNFRIADNDSLKAEAAVTRTIDYLTSNDIDYRLCKMSSDVNVKTEEIKNIIECIVKNTDNLDEMVELVRIIVSSYFVQSKDKDVRDIDFITFTLRAKPNSKDKNEIRKREIIEGWLDKNSPAYRRRKSRVVTKISYNKAVLTYFTLVIQTAAKGG